MEEMEEGKSIDFVFNKKDGKIFLFGKGFHPGFSWLWQYPELTIAGIPDYVCELLCFLFGDMTVPRTDGSEIRFSIRMDLEKRFRDDEDLLFVYNTNKCGPYFVRKNSWEVIKDGFGGVLYQPFLAKPETFAKVAEVLALVMGQRKVVPSGEWCLELVVDEKY